MLCVFSKTLPPTPPLCGVAPDIRNNVRSNDVPAPYLTFDFWRNQTITMSEENIQPKAHIIYKHIFALYVSQTVASGRFPTPIFVSVKYMKIITTLCQENIKLKSLNNFWIHTSLCVYSMRRNVVRRYKQRNLIQK